MERKILLLLFTAIILVALFLAQRTLIIKTTPTVSFSPPNTTSTPILPANRSINWSDVGIPGGIPSRTVICANVKNAPYNAKGNGVNDDTAAIQNAINHCPANEILYIPAGQ